MADQSEQFTSTHDDAPLIRGDSLSRGSRRVRQTPYGEKDAADVGQPIDGLTGEGRTMHEADAGSTFRDDNPSANPADRGIPKPTDLVPNNVEATLNVNSADLEDLCKLRGIGAIAAQRIVSHREEHGPFGSINDLIVLDGFERSRVAQMATQGAYAG